MLRFFKTPKGLLTIILLLLAGVAAPFEGGGTLIANLLCASAAASMVDLAILRMRHGAWHFPSGAILTALIVSMVIRAQEPWYVSTATSVVAVLSKYVLRTRSANVLNPAAVALVVMFYVLPMGQSWWGALPEVTPWWLRGTLLFAGVYITDRVNKMPLVLSFLGAYFLLFTLTAFMGDARRVAEIFRSPDLEAALFFAFIILTDPPTSPAKYRDQLICGSLVAVVAFTVFELFGVVYFLLAGALVGNVWAAWRRVHRRSVNAFPQKMALFLQEIGFVFGSLK